jgi:hypothetical protein
MKLNINSIPLYIEKIFDSEEQEHYEIYQSHPAYEYLFHTFLSIEAMTSAICINKKIEIPDNGYLGISGKAFDNTVRLMAHSSIEMVLSVNHPDKIPLIVDIGKKTSSHESWAPTLKNWMYEIVYPGFVELYEKNKSNIHKNNRDISKLAKLIRDSISHGRKITSKDYPVSWNGFELTRKDDKQPMSNYFLYADIIIVAICMLNKPPLE